MIADQRGSSGKRFPLLSAAFGAALVQDVERLCRVQPRLLGQLATYSTACFHAVAVWLYFAQRPVEEQDIANHLYHTSPRKLLAEVFPDYGPGLWTALGKLPSSVFPLRVFYSRLARLMSGPAAPAMLGLEQIGFRDIAWGEWLAQHAAEEPLMIHAAKGTQTSGPARLSFTQSAFFLLRTYGILTDDKNTISALRRIKDSAGLDRFVMRRLNKIEVDVPATLAGGKLRSIRTINDLHALGRRFENCLSWNFYYMDHFMRQKTWFFEWRGMPPAVVSCEVFGSKLIGDVEIAGHQNAAIGDDVRKDIMNELAGMGIRVLPSAPATIAKHFGESMRSPEPAVDELLDALDKDEDDFSGLD